MRRRPQLILCAMSDFKIRVIFDRCHTATSLKTAPVEVEVYSRGRRRRFRTGVAVCQGQFKNGRVVGRADAAALNARIGDKMEEVRVYADIGMPRRVTPESLTVTFPDWLEHEILDRKDITESTRRTHLVLVEEVRRCGLFNSFRNLTAANIREWDRRLHGKGITQGSVHSYHKRMKTYIGRAVAEGVVKVSPYSGMKIPRGRTVGRRRYLTLDQVHAIEDLRLVGLEGRIRDLFLLSCYTGLAYSDLMKVDRGHVREEGGKCFLEDARRKTGSEYRLVLLPKALAILEKYDWKLPQIPNQVCNRALKYVALAAEIKTHLTMHVGRHTFATLALSQGVAIEVVSKMLAHSDIKTTQIYAKVLQEDVVKGFEKLNF